MLNLFNLNHVGVAITVYVYTTHWDVSIRSPVMLLEMARQPVPVVFAAGHVCLGAHNFSSPLATSNINA